MCDGTFGALITCFYALQIGDLHVFKRAPSRFFEDNISNSKVLLTFIIAADGTTNSQVGTVNGVHGTTAVDSTVAQALSVTADWSWASNYNSITLGQAVLEKLS